MDSPFSCRSLFQSIPTLASLITASILTGCVSTDFDASKLSTSHDQAKALPLFADLTFTEQGWRFKNVTYQQADRPQILLGAYEPVNMPTPKTSSCWRGLFGLTKGSCNQHPFVSSRPDWGNLAMPLFWPFTAFIYPFSKLSGEENASQFVFPVSQTEYFDWDAYSEAIKEAKTADNFDQDFPRIYRKLASLHREQERYQADYKKDYDQLNNDLQKTFPAHLSINIIDNSGFANTQTLEDALSPKDLVTTTLESEAPRQFRYISSNHDIDHPTYKAIYPSSSLKELALNVEIAQANFAKAKALDSEVLQLAGPLSNTSTEEGSSLTRMHYGKLLIEQKNIPSILADYNLNIMHPKSLSVSGKTIKGQHQIDITISSKKFTDLTPSTFLMQNQDVQFQYQDNQLQLTNKSERAVSITRIGLIHKDEVAFASKAGLRGAIKIAAGQTISLPSSILQTEHFSDDYAALTRKQASQMNIDFGFLVHYQSVHQKNIKQLKKVQRYPLLTLIQQ